MNGDDLSTGGARIVLLRHGRSEWNAARRWQGRFDSPLDDIGHLQAHAAGAALARATLDGNGLDWGRPVAGPLDRAARTAAIIGRRLGVGPPRLDERLTEADAGEWEGLTADEIDAAYPGWLRAGHRPDTFEPAASVVSRATAALADIAGSADASVVIPVVSHSGVIRSLVRSAGHPDTRIANLAGIWLRVTATTAPPGLEPGPGIVIDGWFGPPDHDRPVGTVDRPVAPAAHDTPP